MKESLYLLFEKFLNNRCSEAETRELLEHFKAGDDEKQLKQLIINELEKSYDNHLTDDVDERLNQIYSSVKNHILTQNSETPVRHIKLWPHIAAAASIIAIITVGLFYKMQKHNYTGSKVAKVKKGLAPINHKVYLTLANGKKISLTDVANGNIAKQASVNIAKVSNGQLVYITRQTYQDAVTAGDNTLEVPRGSQYQVQLPDGSAVWLNAASKLKYPASFANQKQRIVELVGEAYFEVAKDKEHPFIVKTNNQEVKVLGTHFNINAYTNTLIKTTLLEGSVKVSSILASSPAPYVVIKSGEMALNTLNKISVAEANIKNETAWKSGYFVFNNKSIKDIMNEIARWYDIDVEYHGNVSDVTIGGSISRLKSIEEVLYKIELTESVHFKITGRRVIVSI